ncbi:hypothetical protein DF16_orf04423 [Bacillus thuringiensis serovar kurstaki str. YBT-1520]|nr:hypothetical protein HD73_1837 [Bacillus thuringiensis serovar kurstaki str. HD73]AIM32838.1 hypothetical protein DF16_orf04423 [Bacillus thuringiensis serovar kurstaki str. YBT-1520]EEM54139.1 hypothetical protein bthur0006_14940 [Bacillus thuringiensis serovar kurstaki str. T03a001]KEH45853.1 hypothetical protein BG09_5472 [Bacillus thuringiensis serovar kurstaki str. HD-1]
MYSIQLRILHTRPVLYLFKNSTEKLFKNTKNKIAYLTKFSQFVYI